MSMLGFPDMDPKLLGRRIRDTRHARDMNKTELAHRCGVTERTVVRWENGDNIPQGKYLIEVARVLGVDTAWLLEPDGDEVAA
jgi:transcriptional regulator with XRE-family HTH domain